MAGVGLGVVAVLVLFASGLLVAALLRVRGTAHVLLAAYTMAFAEIVGLALLLSPFDGVTRANLLTGSITLLVAVGATWVIVGSPPIALAPRPWPRRPDPGTAAPQFLLAAVVALALAYVVALVLFTPPNGWDPLNYHLPRAASWVQSHHIGYIEPTYDERLNLNPPNAEIAFAYVLAVTRDETMTGFVQFFAALACALGVFALARRIGLTRLEAAFGALLFLSLPIVALQASLSKNDLVVASFLVVAATFVLGDSRPQLGIAAVATALAVGAKSTATYGVVVLLALALVARRSGRAARVTAIAIGALAGAYWYVVNAVESGRLLGDQSAQQGVTAPLHGAANVVTAWGMLVDTLDVSGARGRDVLLYGIAAVLLAAALLRRRGRRSALIAAAIVATPFVLLLLSEHVGRPSLVRLYDALGAPRGFLGEGSPASPTVASDTASWFGAVGLLFVLGAVAGLWLRRKRRSTTRVVAVLGLASAVWFALVAVSLSYNPWLGRFFIFPVALSAALWGVVSRWPPAAWAASVLASLTMVLSLVHYEEKPSGLRLLDRSSTGSVWTMKRWEVQSQHVPALGPLLRFAEEEMPAKASVALAFADNGFGYPFFGPHLDRHVVIVPFGSSAKDVRADWLVATPERAPEIDASCWKRAFTSSEGDAFRRVSSCS